MPTKRPAVRGAAAAQRRTARSLALLESHYGRQRHVPRFPPMDELVCCMLSQHSADINSFTAFTALKERWPDHALLAGADVGELAHVIKLAGLANQKAKGILASLAQIKNEFGDYSLDPLRSLTVSEALCFLKSLPGVGPKTAAIVMCLAFGRHAVPVDTHVHRVSLRLGLLPEGTTTDQAHDLLGRLVADGHAFRFHVTFLNHGRSLCLAQSPRCGACPVAMMCGHLAKERHARK